MYNLLIFRSYNHTIYPKKIKIGWNLHSWLRNSKFWKLFTHGSSSNDHESLKDLAFRPCTRCNFDYNEQQHQESCPQKVNFWSKNLSRNLRNSIRISLQHLKIVGRSRKRNLLWKIIHSTTVILMPKKPFILLFRLKSFNGVL